MVGVDRMRARWIRWIRCDAMHCAPACLSTRVFFFRFGVHFAPSKNEEEENKDKGTMTTAFFVSFFFPYFSVF